MHQVPVIWHCAGFLGEGFLRLCLRVSQAEMEHQLVINAMRQHGREQDLQRQDGDVRQSKVPGEIGGYPRIKATDVVCICPSSRTTL